MENQSMGNWKPKEIIIHEKVGHDPVTKHILGQCKDIPVKYIDNGIPGNIIKLSKIVSKAGTSMLDKVLAGKKALYLSPVTEVVDVFTMPDDRMVCPLFDRLKLASNGCFYKCDWCYLKLTYRAVFPFITIRLQYDRIKKKIQKKLNQAKTSVIFNSGELADSLSMDHLTKAAEAFIPWFGQTQKGYLYMLTKSENVDNLLTVKRHETNVSSKNIPRSKKT